MKRHIVKFSQERLFTAFASATLLFVSSAAAQNVGIGVSNPQSKLSVNGTTAGGGLAIGDSTYTSTSGTVAPASGALIQIRVEPVNAPASILVRSLLLTAIPDTVRGCAASTANQSGWSPQEDSRT
jgi:hypothetical protein